MAPSSDAPTFARAAPSAASFTAPVVSRRQATFKKPVVPALPLPYLQRHSTATSQARLRSADPTATTDLGGTSSRAAEQKVEPLLLPRIPRSPGEKDSLLSSAVDDSSDAKRNCQGPSAGGWELDAEEPTPPADVEASRHRNSLSSSTQGEATPLDVPTDAPPSSSFRRSATSPPIHMPPRSLPNASASSTVPRGICHSPMHLVDSLEQPYGFTHRSNVHQHHPNNSGLVFGGFQDSNTSSPAPPNSRGAPPPPPNLSLPSISPMACTSEPPTVTDVVDQGALITAPAPANGRPPMINNFGPSTPHSFHGSQSSTCMDENSYNHLYLANGHNSLESELYSGISALPPARYPVSTTLPALEMDNREDILRTVRQGFANSEFADCELHLHIGESQPPEYLSSPSYRNPLLLAAHRLILARSPSLRNIMVAQGVPNGKVTVSSEDPFLRSDAFWFAVQTLYGYPLYEVHSDPSSADRTMDNFGLALGYAAAGHLLQLLPVIAQGIRDAVRLVNWTTLEKALEFAMAGATVLYPVGPKTPSSQQIIMPRYRHGPALCTGRDSVRPTAFPYPANATITTPELRPRLVSQTVARVT
ncbi:hypothetical protein NKR23_g7182 [Pleurostoma richardsiae]|uniref:Uncharacterized protein n=1 Tax=Pleurostoma richardsiae TaxID=41990 RepID=A0AA38RBV5_9PEZI|nr:hypothetical protein NKR23_g7182 [Pleurostoma richardsiae]